MYSEFIFISLYLIQNRSSNRGARIYSTYMAKRFMRALNYCSDFSGLLRVGFGEYNSFLEPVLIIELRTATSFYDIHIILDRL